MLTFSNRTNVEQMSRNVNCASKKKRQKLRCEITKDRSAEF